ncbi:MAG: DUF2971 domain-containing protein [Acidobacteriia bacterium]|nr:DUF2971 domain-containing protein [Terriglobia bacterium]
MPVFKYMSTEVAPLFVKTLKVRFTQPSDLNDPFELRPLIDFKGTAEEFRDALDAKMTEMLSTVDGVFAAMVTIPNYSKMSVPIQMFRNIIAANPALEQEFMAKMQVHKAEALEEITKVAVWEILWKKIQQSLGQLLGIFCLTEDAVHPLMWSHYAGQHYGIVVEFDENHPWFNQKVAPPDDFRHLVRVSYVQNPHPRTWHQLNGPDVFYTKNAEWAYEREWRIIRPLKDGTEVSSGTFCFDVPATAVRSITFGCRTTPTLEAEIRAAVAANPALTHVCFKRAKLGGGGKIELVDAIP